MNQLVAFLWTNADFLNQEEEGCTFLETSLQTTTAVWQKKNNNGINIYKHR